MWPEQGVKAFISGLIIKVSTMPEREIYFKAVENLVSGSTKLVECRVKKGMAADFGSEYKMATEEEAARRKILDSLEILRRVENIPEIDPDIFSALLVEDYFTNRIR